MTDAGAAVTLPEGREVRYFDSAAGAEGGAGARSDHVLVWHGGTPHTGRILAPLRAAVEAAGGQAGGIRLISLTRAGYPGSPRVLGRSVADSARDALAVLDALGVERFATMGSSGGGPHALALAALAPERTTGVATFSSVAPYRAGDEDWFAGMVDPRALRAATEGLEARTRHAETAEFDPTVFTEADWAAVNGEWSDLGADAVAAAEAGPDGEIDDDLAFVSDWGVDLADIRAHVLIVQGEQDRMVPAGHATRLLRALPDATSWWLADDGHVSVLRAVPRAIGWLREHGL